MSWFRVDGEFIIVTIHAQPGAKCTEIHGLHGDALKIRISAPPVAGKANAELIRFLAETFGVRQNDVELIRGDSSRSKRFRIRGSAVNPASCEVAKKKHA